MNDSWHVYLLTYLLTYVFTSLTKGPFRFQAGGDQTRLLFCVCIFCVTVNSVTDTCLLLKSINESERTTAPEHVQEGGESSMVIGCDCKCYRLTHALQVAPDPA